MKINIIIPAYNEESRLEDTLEAFQKTFYSDKADEQCSNFAKQHDLALYVINDGSADNTEQLAVRLLSQYGLRGKVLGYDINRGKGHAVRHGVLHSREADCYYLADSDLSASWDVLIELFEVLDQTDADCVVGSRATQGAEVSTKFSRKFAGRLSNFLINIVLHTGVKDTQCGYKLFRNNCLPAFQAQILNRYGYDFELLYLLRKLNGKIVEHGIRWTNKSGSKVKPIDFFRTLYELWRVRTNNYVF